VPKGPLNQSLFSRRVSSLRLLARLAFTCRITLPTYVARMAKFYDTLLSFSQARRVLSRELRAENDGRCSYVHACEKEPRINTGASLSRKDDGSFYYIVTRGAVPLRLFD